MHILLDHLIAIVIGTVIFLTLSIAQMRSSHAGVEQVASHGVKTKTLVFGHWVERDILDLGKNLGRNRYRFESPTDSAGQSIRWVFHSDSVKANGDSVRVLTRYRLVQTRRIQMRNTSGTGTTMHQLYEVRRDTTVETIANGRINGVAMGAWTVANVPSNRWIVGRRTIGTLTSFDIDLVGRDGVVRNADEDRADYVRVRFGVVPEYILSPENYLREYYWVTTLKVRPFWEPPPDV